MSLFQAWLSAGRTSGRDECPVQALYVAITSTERCPIRVAASGGDLAAPFPHRLSCEFSEARVVYEFFFADATLNIVTLIFSAI